MLVKFATGPNGSFSCISDVTINNTFTDSTGTYCFPNPLTYHLLGYRVSTSGPDFTIEINWDIQWNYDVDPDDYQDGAGPYLVNMARHEIGHTVGFQSGRSVDRSRRTSLIRSPHPNGHLLV